jgi:ubiquinone/menaquinone biosynthesis C-methylase UbiE
MNNDFKKHKKTVQEYFSSKTKYWNVLYDENHKNDTFMNFVMRRRKQSVLDLIDKEIDKNKNIKVLDVGCGTGVYVDELVKRGFSVYGLDISKEMVERSLLRIEESKKTYVRLSVGDAELLPFKENFFDLIISVGVLEYLPSEINALSEFKRLLKPSGILIFTLPNLFKLRHFFDPYYYFNRSVKLIVYKIFRKRGEIKIEKDEISRNDFFTNKRYRKKQIYTFLKSCDLKEKTILGVGYGSFSFWQKDIFPLSWSIKLSNFLERLAESKFFRILDKTATRWVICAQKKIT